MRGAIAAGSSRTAWAGAEIFRQGGNAADAAVAATFASFVAEIVLNNPGGGGVAVIRESTGRLHAWDFFSTMPGIGAEDRLAAGRDALDFRPKEIVIGPSRTTYYIGRASTAVPGTIKGLVAIHERFGRLPFAEVVAPAIHLAREGVALSAMYRYIAKVLEPIFSDTPEMNALFQGPDHYLANADDVRLEGVAALLELLRDEGADALYSGSLAHALAEDHHRHGGLVTRRDLADYRVLEYAPAEYHHYGWTMAAPPLPSQGGSMVLLMLQLRSAIEAELGPAPLESASDLARWGVVIEAANLLRDRIEGLQGPSATREAVMFAYHDAMEPALDAARRGAPFAPLPPAPRVPGNTVHVSVIDESGMAVGITSSAGESAGYLVPGPYTLMMNNMLGEGDLHPRGFLSAQPGSRLSTMMAPTLLQRGDGREATVVVMGSGGSSRIRSAMSQTAWLLGHHGLDIAPAIEALRSHHEQGVLQLEGTRDAAVLEALTAGGFNPHAWGERSAYFGGVHAVKYHAGEFTAHGDPRRGGCTEIVD